MQLAHGIKHRPALRIGTGEREARIGTADVGNKETGWRYCGHVESRGARKAGDNSNEAARSTAHASRCGSDQASVVSGTRAGNASASRRARSEEHTSELQSLMRISYAVFCLKKK